MRLFAFVGFIAEVIASGLGDSKLLSLRDLCTTEG